MGGPRHHYQPTLGSAAAGASARHILVSIGGAANTTAPRTSETTSTRLRGEVTVRAWPVSQPDREHFLVARRLRSRSCAGGLAGPRRSGVGRAADWKQEGYGKQEHTGGG